MPNGLYDACCTPLTCMDYFMVILGIFGMPLQQFFLGIANLQDQQPINVENLILQMGLKYEEKGEL